MARHIHVYLHTHDNAGFDESKHPRDDDGKFGSGGGHAVAPVAAPAAKKAKAPKVDPAQHKADAHAQTLPVLREAVKNWGREIPDDVLQAAAEYMHGKKSIDPLRMEDAVPGMNIGLIKHLRKAMLEHFASGRSSGPQTQAQRIDSYLKQKHIGPIRR